MAAGAAAAPPEISYISWNRKVQHILASTQVCEHNNFSACSTEDISSAVAAKPVEGSPSWKLLPCVDDSTAAQPWLQDLLLVHHLWLSPFKFVCRRSMLSINPCFVVSHGAFCLIRLWILTCQVDGATVVWDLKKQRPVITLKDPNRWGDAYQHGHLEQRSSWGTSISSSNSSTNLVASDSNSISCWQSNCRPAAATVARSWVAWCGLIDLTT